MTEADKMLEEVGIKRYHSTSTRYEHDMGFIRFRTDEKKMYIQGLITMEQLKAINKKCEELGW